MLLRWQSPKHLRLACRLDDGPTESPDPLSRAMGNAEEKKPHWGALLRDHFQPRESLRRNLLEAFNFACQSQDLV